MCAHSTRGILFCVHHLHLFWSVLVVVLCLFMQDSSINLGANSGYNHLTFALLEKPPPPNILEEEGSHRSK